MKKIMMTGGGTAGHVTPNMALIEQLRKEGFDIRYIGRKQGIEKDLIEPMGIPYDGISSGKLRRYLDMKNVTDVFNILRGLGEANKILKKEKPDLVFSKGGFVTVPVVIAAWRNKIPVIVHESDMSCGLANKIAIPFANYICCTFPETVTHLPKNKSRWTGTPIRAALFQGNAEKGRKFCGFSDQKPILLLMGGSLGSVVLNQALRNSLDTLLKDFQIIHICGKNNFDDTIQRTGYCQFEYVSKELSDLFAAADMIVSRAGANSISEFLALKKPNLLIPLSRKASRGDQILNAQSFQKQGFSAVLEEEDLTPESLVAAIQKLYQQRPQYIQHMEKSPTNQGVLEVMGVIREVLK